MLLVPKSMPSSVPRRISGGSLPFMSRDTLYRCSERIEGCFEVFVAPVDPLDAFHNGLSSSHKAGDHKCGPAPEVGCRDHRAVESRHTGYNAGSSILVDDCPH